MRRLAYNHPFLILVASVALAATAVAGGAAWSASALHDHLLERDANCPAIGEVWSSSADQCVPRAETV